MSRRNWKKTYPSSIRNAMELCTQYALAKKNLSVERIAELMGEASHWTLYKWMESGRMPAVKIRPFEHACGINFVTQYQAHSSGMLLIPVPSGRQAEHREINELSIFMNQTIALLYKHQEGSSSAKDTIDSLTQLMESVAYQRGNVEKESQPELEL